MGIANLTKFEDFALSEKEADTLAKATSNLLEAFDFQPDPRFVAVSGFVSTAGSIYIPRAYLFKRHMDKKRAETEEEKSGEVVPFNPFGVTGVMNDAPKDKP